jgi:hypothetical protein
VTEPDIAEGVKNFYKNLAIPAESFAQAVAYAMSQPEAVDINEILFRPHGKSINLTVVYMPDKRGMSVLELGCRSATEPMIRRASKGRRQSSPVFLHS